MKRDFPYDWDSPQARVAGCLEFGSPFPADDLEEQADEEVRAEGRRDLVDLRPSDERLFFDQWWDSPKELARLLRWISLRDIVISDVPAFLEAPRTWQREYEHMLAWEKRGRG